MSVPLFFSLSDVARKFGIAPRVVSDLFYQRKLDDARRIFVAGRSLIPADYMPDVEAAVRRELSKPKRKRRECLKKAH